MAEYSQEQLQMLAKAQADFKKEYKFRNRLHGLVSALSGAVIVMITCIIAGLFIFQVNHIYGNGMEPNIKNEHYAFSNRLAYKMRLPQRGEVITTTDGHMYRIIGLPGEKVNIFAGHIYINDELVTEDYQLENVLTFPVAGYEETQVPAGTYYVLCDNRMCYDDSRMGRTLPLEAISSKVLFIL